MLPIFLGFVCDSYIGAPFKFKTGVGKMLCMMKHNPLQLVIESFVNSANFVC